MLRKIRQKLLNPVLYKLTEHDEILSKLLINMQKLEEKINFLLTKDENHQVAEIPYLGKKLLFVIQKNVFDDLSEEIRKGNLPINSMLVNLFNKSGTFLDIGGNIGVFSIAFAAKGWKGLTIEASAKNVEVLVKSVNLNNFDIRIINKAISDSSGELFFMQAGPYGRIKQELHKNCDYEKIDCICLDDCINTYFSDISTIDFIKIDIEGSEVAALKGMQNFLDFYNYPTIYIEVNTLCLCEQGESYSSLMNELKKLGYSAYTLNDDSLQNYNMEMFPKSPVFDLLMMKNIPVDFSEKIEHNKYVADDLSYIENILEKYSSQTNNEGLETACVAYTLKDYPQYNSLPNIINHLSRITKTISEIHPHACAYNWIKEAYPNTHEI